MTRPAMRRASTGRKTMKSSMAKMAVALAVLLVVVGGIVLWMGTKSGVALADVLAKMEQVQAFMYKVTMHVTRSAPEVPLDGKDMEMSMLVADEYGMRMDMSLADPNRGQAMAQQMYWLPRQKMMMTVRPAMKTYMRIEFDDSMFEETKKENNDPREMVRQILDCKYEELGKSVIDGVEVEGFRTTDPVYAGAAMGEVDVKIWVDRKNGLPVRMEMKMKMNEPMGMEMEGTLHDFQWNVPVSAAEFTPVIPADYTAGPADGMKVPAMTEETAVMGLKLCADLSGKYPDDLNVMTLIQVVTEEFKSEPPIATQEPPQPPEPPQLPGPTASHEEREKSLKEMEKWNAEVEKWNAEVEKWRAERMKTLEDQKKMMDGADGQIKKAMDKMMPVQALGGFYMTLVQGKKEPAYYGKVVQPGDAAQVLLRWKTADNEYRVIFGDLHTLTVNTDTLAKLEAALPK
jgi:outer membrane lipoprotein-sorting protein